MKPRRIEQIIKGKETKLVGDFSVKRILPQRNLRRIGGFVFLDHFGKVVVKPEDFDVPPHPHVGLQTVTYLYSGEILHRDSLGSEQLINPGDVNWMTAGKGITHSEQGIKHQEYHGIQSWIGLPHNFRQTDPAFENFERDNLPKINFGANSLRVIAGEFEENVSPITTFQPLTYFDLLINQPKTLEIPVNPKHEIGLYVVEGEIKLSNTIFREGMLAKFSDEGQIIFIEPITKARLMIFGGEPLPEPTVIYWNFITDTIGEAKQKMIDWKTGLFPEVKNYEKL